MATITINSMTEEEMLTILETAMLAQLASVNAQIARIQRELRGPSPSEKTQSPLKPTGRAPVGARRRHRMSAEGRARIAAAQRKRWAAYHQSVGE